MFYGSDYAIELIGDGEKGGCRSNGFPISSLFDYSGYTLMLLLPIVVRHHGCTDEEAWKKTHELLEFCKVYCND
jgi:hypothetical protein